MIVPDNIETSYEGPFTVSRLRAERWTSIPRTSGVYRWYFPVSSLETLGITSRCNIDHLNLAQLDDGMIALYFGIANDLAQRVKWHAAQSLRPSAGLGPTSPDT